LETLPTTQTLEAGLGEILVVVIFERRFVRQTAGTALSRQALQFWGIHVPLLVNLASRAALGARSEEFLAIATLVPRLGPLSVVIVLEYVLSGFTATVVAKRAEFRHRTESSRQSRRKGGSS